MTTSTRTRPALTSDTAPVVAVTLAVTLAVALSLAPAAAGDVPWLFDHSVAHKSAVYEWKFWHDGSGGWYRLVKDGEVVGCYSVRWKEYYERTGWGPIPAYSYENSDPPVDPPTRMIEKREREERAAESRAGARTEVSAVTPVRYVVPSYRQSLTPVYQPPVYQARFYQQPAYAAPQAVYQTTYGGFGGRFTAGAANCGPGG